MCKVCTEAVDCVALWTRVTLGLDMCKVCTEAVDCVALWTRVTLGLDMCKVCTEAVDCVALWTRVTLGLDMCKVCNEAVHMAKSRKRVPRVSKWTKNSISYGDYHRICARLHAIGALNKPRPSRGYKSKESAAFFHHAACFKYLKQTNL